MNREERLAQIAKIKAGAPVATGTKLVYQGETQDFSVFKVPLDFLVYNVDNGRIATVVKSYNHSCGNLNAESDDGAKKIADFLYHSNEDRNKTTMYDLAEHGQQEPGIITADGVIVDGNRRASLLNRIRNCQTDEFTQDQKDKSSYFLTRILPEEASTREILKLETTYQMSVDGKVDYNPLEKYLHAKDLKDNNFTEKEISSYMGIKSEAEVKKILRVQVLMDEYLQSYGYDGIYTMLPQDCEDKLLKLESSISRIRSGAYSWIAQSDLEETIVDLKALSFDYIRLGLTNEEFRLFSYTKDSNVLNDEQTWNDFKTAHFAVVEKVSEESTGDLLEGVSSDKDAENILQNRDNEWRNQVKGRLSDNYDDAKEKVESKKAESQPINLIRRSINALSAINLQNLADRKDVAEIKNKMIELVKLVEEIQRSLS